MSNKRLGNAAIPMLADVIRKIKGLQDLTPEEELVYLVFIEKLPVEKAKKIIEYEWDDSENEKRNSQYLNSRL